MRSDPRFLSPMGEELSRLGLRVEDVNVGRHVKIDLSTPRPVPEEFSEFGRFDTLTVLNSSELTDGCEVWLYLNNDRPESRLPLHMISSLDTIADRFYIQHENSIPCVLHLVIGGDLRAFNPRSRELGKVQIPGVATDEKLEEVRALLEDLEAKAATENTLEAARTLLASIDGKDFATQTTLAALESKDFATETTLEAVRALLASIDGKDFATQTTLAALEGKDFATETTLEAVRALVEALELKDFATQTTLETILSELQAQTALLQEIRDNTAT